MVKRALNRKMWRDLWQLKAQIPTTATLIICGVSLMVAEWSAYRSLQHARDTYYRDYQFEEERTEVTAEFLDPAANVFQNVGSTFHVDVTFKVSETQDALKVPVGSLFRDGPDWVVYLADGGRAHKTKVEVGALGSQEALIKAGLSAGQEVLVYPGDLVQDGSRIRVEATKNQ